MQEWDDLRFFLNVAQTGSVTAASIKLGVNQSTVSRRINSFEKIMNVRLFERLSSGFELTPEGKELLDYALQIEEEILAIDRNIKGKNIKLSGPIKVTTSIAIAHYLLLPIFKRFNKLHPDIELHLDMSNNLYNLTQREADIAIRVTSDAIPENLIGRELGAVEYAVYGEKKYIETYTKSKKAQALQWIGENNNDRRPSWLPDNIEPIHLIMRSNEVIATYEAIKQGLGIGRLPSFMAKTSNKIIAFKSASDIPPAPVWLLTHVDMRRVKRMSVFSSFVAEEMRRILNFRQDNLP